MNSETKLSHKAKKRIKEVKRKARPGKSVLSKNSNLCASF